MQWRNEFIVGQAQQVRLRAFCNSSKRRLLGEAADPWTDQAAEVAAAPLDSAGSRRGSKPAFLVSEAQCWRRPKTEPLFGLMPT